MDRADLAALQSLQRFLEEYGVKVAYDYLPLEGSAPVWGPGSVVVGGPKMSVTIAAGLGYDPTVRFMGPAAEGGAWVLADLRNDENYVSPRDGGKNEDYGYLGRVCKPGRAHHTFLSVAGVHAPGSAIVAHYLCDFHVVLQLDRRFKGAAFSGIVKGTYQAEPLTVCTSDEVVMRPWADDGRGAEVFR